MTARNPLLLPLCGMVAGILSAKFFRFYPLELALTAIGFALLWALALWKTRRVALLPCLGLIGVAGVFTAEFHRPSPPPKLNIEDNETVLLSGCIADVPSYAGDRVRFALEFDRGCAGISRHVVGDERALQERRKRIHPDPESCDRRREVSVEA